MTTTTPADQRRHESESAADEAAQVLELAHRARRQHPSVYRGPIDQGPTTAEQARAIASALHRRYGDEHTAEWMVAQVEASTPDHWRIFATRTALPRPTSAVLAAVPDAIRARWERLAPCADPFAGIAGNGSGL